MNAPTAVRIVSWDASRPTSTRVHFLLAELDDYTPAKYCKVTANREAAP